MKPCFPKYRDHRGVTCFNCHELLDLRGAYASGYPDGAWAQDCRSCEMTTFYDVEPVEPSAEKDARRVAQLSGGQP